MEPMTDPNDPSQTPRARLGRAILVAALLFLIGVAVWAMIGP